MTDEEKAEIAQLRAQIAELKLTLLNERGLGDPPNPAWVWIVPNTTIGHWFHVSDLVGCYRATGGSWYCGAYNPKNLRATAREAMREYSERHTNAETPCP